uniref:Uncharacterized protein n=1 Tax=Oncorhynchus tshawytscha TaxID=74940 RepID=A0AAZ3PTB3_ONCTS
MEPQGLFGAEGDCGMLGLLVPSPQSEAFTHELEKLSLQPSNNLHPPNERKNGDCCSGSSMGLAKALMNEHMITGLNRALETPFCLPGPNDSLDGLNENSTQKRSLVSPLLL